MVTLLKRRIMQDPELMDILRTVIKEVKENSEKTWLEDEIHDEETGGATPEQKDSKIRYDNYYT
ncbi:MAG: hypothetical protein HWN65_06005 [Candidatus Helarchaeota archaeon]|nr:hypothetical protein [Candidatus Helarchaeota archaeon]